MFFKSDVASLTKRSSDMSSKIRSHSSSVYMHSERDIESCGVIQYQNKERAWNWRWCIYECLSESVKWKNSLIHW